MRAKPDVYYGDVAVNYDASRAPKAKWQNELAALEEFLTDGPVLDVPFGTGRFVPVYRTKGLAFKGVDISGDMLALARQKHPEVDVSLGSAFDLRFAENEFATAVCVRFLEWLPIERARALLDQLRRIASTLIVTINHGIEGVPDAYTYDYEKFLRAIDGLLIAARRETARIPGITSEMFKLRPAQWADVVDQFRFDCPEAPERDIQRIVTKHCLILGIPPLHLNPDRVTVRAEHWTPQQLAVVVRQHERMIVPAPPRHADAPITILHAAGQLMLLDGRHRANRWAAQTSGLYPVLVMRPHG